MFTDIRKKAARWTGIAFRPFVPLGKSVVELDNKLNIRGLEL